MWDLQPANLYKYFTNNANVNNVNDEKFIYKELSYRIVGLIYTVYNALGYGYREKYYERALAKEFKKVGLAYEVQKTIPLKYEGEIIGKYIIDFVVEDKIVLELKVMNSIRNKDLQQILSYLTANNLKLGILALITRNGVRYRRILNTR